MKCKAGAFQRAQPVLFEDGDDSTRAPSRVWAEHMLHSAATALYQHMPQACAAPCGRHAGKREVEAHLRGLRNLCLISGQWKGRDNYQYPEVYLR